MRLTQFGYLACGVLVLSLWLPWGKLAVGLLGSDSSGLGTIDGQKIGSGVLNLPSDGSPPAPPLSPASGCLSGRAAK